MGRVATWKVEDAGGEEALQTIKNLYPAQEVVRILREGDSSTYQITFGEPEYIFTETQLEELIRFCVEKGAKNTKGWLKSPHERVAEWISHQFRVGNYKPTTKYP